MSLLEVINLKKYFPVMGGIIPHQIASIKAVDGVNFSINEGETLGLLGESGCGKTTVGRSILGTIKITEGTIKFLGEDISRKEVLKKHRKDIQMIFQDPYSSLNPMMTVADIVWEPINIHKTINNKIMNKEDAVIDLFDKVELADYHIYRYPHEFSGGQKQRIAIARAIALNPKLIICDEPVANLDVSVGAQILNLLVDLQQKYNLTYLFISHNISILYHISNYVAVMYLGKIVEMARTSIIFSNPLHPYTKALLSAVPIPDPTIKAKKIILKGEIPTALDPPSGCRFRTRCPIARKICAEKEPLLLKVSKDQLTACHFINDS